MKKVNKAIRVKVKTFAFIFIFFTMVVCMFSNSAKANETNQANKKNNKYEISVSVPDSDANGKSTSAPNTVKMLIMLTIITLAPSILIMLTCFIRIIVVLHFTRSAIGTQTSPPNQVLIGLALFLTYFIMSSVFVQVNEKAIKPYSAGKINTEQAVDEAMNPLRGFMLKQTRNKDINMFAEIAKIKVKDKSNFDKEKAKMPNRVIIPAYIISELRSAFIIGFLIYVPFIIIDMVVASTLMSMGMMMLPPTVISLPFKILLFILADGWNLVIGNLVKTFY